jgi:3-methyladenine DNA glycosylase AlkD
MAKASAARGGGSKPRGRTPPSDVDAALTALEKMSTKRDMDNLQRFGIDAPKAFGVSMANIQQLARRLGQSHDLAAALWASGWYEARMLAAFVDDPALVTPAQMERWCRDFDNWGICDTVCFKLFDRTPHAWDKVTAWHGRRKEFEKRAAFALLASLAGHDRTAADARFIEGLALVERAADDERNFVKKGVLWALRRIGTRNAALDAAAIATARRLAASAAPAARWIGREALREMTRGAKTRGAKTRAPKTRAAAPARKGRS